ncbi:hypothetical protein GOP47_0014139 [Adiantum capillus-veneris]|uniref:Protein kinase domain-containing protein n=1 Tax=Adiantum capillus-veneris TaxID=13818 RepID=A0A9D4ZDW1_ADICA|nr:hypothetical protein GOP47_0014139 [Adiantum capillus-veneris]
MCTNPLISIVHNRRSPIRSGSRPTSFAKLLAARDQLIHQVLLHVSFYVCKSVAVHCVSICPLLPLSSPRHGQPISNAFQVSDHSKLGGAFSSKTLKPSRAGVLNSTYKVHKPHLETHLPSSLGAANASHHGSRSFGSFSRVVFFNGSHQSFQYDLEELEVATNFFSAKNLLGKRAGHSVVYKRVLRDGSSVAIRALHKASYKTRMSQFKVSRPVQWKPQNVLIPVFYGWNISGWQIELL